MTGNGPKMGKNGVFFGMADQHILGIFQAKCLPGQSNDFQRMSGCGESSPKKSPKFWRGPDFGDGSLCGVVLNGGNIPILAVFKP